MKPWPLREVLRKLKAAGFEEVGQSGSHLKYGKKSPTGIRTAIIPKHREIAAERCEVF